MIQVPASFSCWTVICVIEKRRLLETYTTNRPYISLDNNQAVLFRPKSGIKPFSDPWVGRNNNFPTLQANGLLALMREKQKISSSCSCIHDPNSGMILAVSLPRRAPSI